MVKDFTKSLIEKNLISEENLSKIEAINTGGSSLVYKLLSSSAIDEQLFFDFYKNFTDVKTISLKNSRIDDATFNLINADILRKYYSFPIKKANNRLTIAMVDPLDYQAIDTFEKETNCTINPVLATYSDIIGLLDKEFGVINSVKNIVDDLESTSLSPIFIGNINNEIFQTSSNAGPINKLLHLVISHALREKASDIHFEQTSAELQCRFRIDGVLHKFLTFPKQLSNSIISSIKILGKMDIAEKRIPLDGSFQVKIDSKIIDIRVSSFPTIEGEKIAMRILDKESYLFSLDSLGFSQKMLDKFKPLIENNNGIILVTGPTGSGKTTTLYAVLEAIKNIEKNIMTIEDPVEYHLDMINQSQVNNKAGLTFARGLRSFLRQDPDIILVGEVRDKETAEISFQAALTGHLVFSTLHTNDAPSALTRLHDMGIEKYLLSSAIINGILSQRLARKTCPHCQEKYQPKGKTLSWLGLTSTETDFFHGTGCDKCKGTGYLGRIAMFELFIPNEKINSLLRSTEFTTENIRHSCDNESLIPFREDAKAKVLKNITTAEEAYRILR